MGKVCPKYTISLTRRSAEEGAMITSTQREKGGDRSVEKTEKVEKERFEFKQLILKNPNYFGTFPLVKIQPVFPMKCSTKYEELRSVGFYPELDWLEAIIDVKLPYGYKGNLCSVGSCEYVRFFVDWDGDGDFDTAAEDVGIASVNVHDIPDGEKVCLDTTKPLSYAVTLKVDSKKLKCTVPNLLKVRAILSWEMPPPAGDANHVPVWGNVLDKWIQIEPDRHLLKDIVSVVDIQKLKLEPAMLDLEAPISAPQTLTPAQLKEIYKGKDVPEHRYNFSQIHQMVEQTKKDPSLMVAYKKDPKLSQIVSKIDLILAEKPSTRYEELGCVGLNYDMERLVATLTVKLPYGYGGGLCTKGSYEYVAFWAYLWDQIEQMCYWKYLGTSRVNTHDIAKIPPEGLQYAVYLPVDPSSLRERCTKPKLLKIRAILSWQVQPPSTNVNYDPVWGNRVEALVQIKPGDPTHEQKPFIWSAGQMAVESISGNPHTIEQSSIGDGYANGVSIGGGYTACESPFGAVIAISGTIANAPNIAAEADKLRYKVQYKKSTEASWHDITSGFRIWMRMDGVPSGYIDQTAVDGYFRYQKDLTPPVIREVEADMLAQWHTPVPEGDGLYELRVLLYSPNAPPEPGVPADHVSSGIVKVMIDNTSPDVDISLIAGPCEEFKPDATITGKFRATDKHIWYYEFSVLPSSIPSNPVEHVPAEWEYSLLPAPGVTAGTFSLKTTTAALKMQPCGYVIRLKVWDRTITNNTRPGNSNATDVGFCLLKGE